MSNKSIKNMVIDSSMLLLMIILTLRLPLNIGVASFNDWQFNFGVILISLTLVMFFVSRIGTRFFIRLTLITGTFNLIHMSYICLEFNFFVLDRVLVSINLEIMALLLLDVIFNLRIRKDKF